MDKDKATWYRRDVEDLIVAQNRELPMCSHDGKPCLTPESGCFQDAFGVMASDGKSEIFWVCPRFKSKL